MKLLVFDFNTIRSKINSTPNSTKIFEIYYDIARMLEIDISKEACFHLYTRYSNNYGKLRDYICILGNKVDKQRFDEEFYRRYKHLYLNYNAAQIEEIKLKIQKELETISQKYIMALIGIDNISFITNTLKFLGLNDFFVSIKLSEYANDYPLLLDEVLNESTIPSTPPEDIILLSKDEFIINLISVNEKYSKCTFKTIDKIENGNS